MAATIRGWQRFPAAQQWLDRQAAEAAAKAKAAAERHRRTQARAQAAKAAPHDAAEQERLFKEFMEWSRQAADAVTRPAQTTLKRDVSRQPTRRCGRGGGRMGLNVFRRIAVACCAALLMHPGMGWSQSFPSEPIKIVVPFSAGGNTDVTARLIAPVMQEMLGQPIIVENRPGAGGMIAAGGVISSKPDGHTLMMGTNSTVSVGPNVFPNWPYDPIKGITPISIIQTVPFALVVKADSPIKSVQDLVKLAKEKPEEITQAHAGTGSSNHLVSELFQMLTGTKFLLVPYKGAAPAMNDLLGRPGADLLRPGEHDRAAGPGRHGAGACRHLGRRMPALPDTPTFAEAGVKNFEVLNVTGLVGPAGMDPGVVAKLHDATLKALADPKVKEGFAKLGVDVVGSSPQEFAAFIKQDLDLWAGVMREAKVKVR